jgi:hypothetical protein
MNVKKMALVALVAAAIAAPALAATKTYQVTGPVLELTDTSITVQKGTERWEIARDAGTKITGELKVGAKVTIEYHMSAASIEVRPAAAAKAKAEKKP